MSVFSHDEVVHGKSTMIGKMPGVIEDKFANLRLTYGYLMTHPGKKLLFMGQDIAEFKEFDETRQVEWGLLQHREHKGINQLVKDLNFLYREKPALYAKDTSPEGFEWINCISPEKCMLAFVRKSERVEDTLLVVANFAGAEQEFTIGVPYEGKYKELINTDNKIYGGKSSPQTRAKAAREEAADGRECSLTVTLSPLSLVIYSYIPYTRKEKLEIEKRKAEKEAKEQARLAEEQAAQAREEVLAAQKALDEAMEKVALAEELAATSLEKARQAEEELKSLKKGR